MSLESMIAAANAELGAGCPGKINKYSNWYGMPGQAWCAMFISWLADKSGNANVIPRHSYTPSGAAWFKARGQWVADLTKIRPGDIVYFDFPGDGVNRIQHVGVAVSYYTQGGVYTIEGNTSGASQANGGCVQRKFRTKAGGVVGFGRPAYGSATVPSTVKNWLEKGDSGEAVKELQRLLVVAGLSVGSYGIDGEYGNDTTAAVLAYQESRGLVKDGVAGPATMGALRSGAGPVARDADGNIALDEDGVRGSKTITRWQKVMGTIADGFISKPKSSLIVADQTFLNSVVAPEHILALTGKTRLVPDGSEGKFTIKVRQFYLFNKYAQERFNRAPKSTDFDGVNGPNTNTLHQYALNRAHAGSVRY